MAAWSLGLKGDARAVEALVSRLSDDDSHTAAQAAWALGLKGDARAEEGLSKALELAVRRRSVSRPRGRWACSACAMAVRG